ncbi:MAG: AAA family ATPase, partial [Eubacteriales bacterium]|nr:AAA family ATPase [Eubacteriales bacterium]
MRIEKVVIYNINSLSGRFEIDFTDAGYGEGLFAIVGPSGAGKTTVLDAISLALSGKTPRIAMVSETQDELMSKGCDACAAEVVFVSRGRRYKAAFSHQRTKKGAKPFRPAKREILEYQPDGSWRVIAAMIKEAEEKIVELTGLSYSQFTRSIMLAQFQFAEFLKANSNERADILEQITDMDIYRNISIAVFERKDSESKHLGDITARMEAVKVLDETEQQALEQERQALEDTIAAHGALRDGFILCRDTVKKTNALERELEQYEADKPAAERRLAEAAARHELAAAEEKKQKQALLDLQKTLKAVRELDGGIAAKRDDIARIGKEIKKDEERISGHKKSILILFKKYMPDADNEKL